MTQPVEFDPGAEAVLRGLEPLYAPYVNVTPVHLNHPDIVPEFRSGSGKDTDLGDVPKPTADRAFGVELGGIHGGARLCALVFTQFARLQAFYQSNPGLLGTLVSKWPGVAVIWLRASGRLPVNFNADCVRWCSQGIVLVGSLNQPVETYILQQGEIKSVEFSQLVWTEQQQAEVERVLLEMEVGPPFRTVARGRRVLNLAFWARYFTDMMRIAYDPDRKLFAWGDPKVRQPVLLTVDGTTREFTNLLQTAAPSFSDGFPQGEIRPARVRQLVERIKMLITKSRASDDEILDSFLASQVVRVPGKDTTSQEFWAAFVRHCGRINRVATPTSWFLRRLGPKLRAQFSVSKRHDVVRNGAKVRGYTGLALREQVVAAEPDGSGGSDGSDATDGA